jgi:hypothetical protein
VCDCPWHPAAIADLLGEAEKYGEAEDLWMSMRDYADIRKFGRDVLWINTEPKTLKSGMMGTIYDKAIWVLGAAPGWISVRDADGKVLVHALKGGRRGDGTVDHAHHRGHPHSCSDPECIVRFVMAG